MQAAKQNAKTKSMAISRWVSALVQASNRELTAIGRNINQIAKVLNESFYRVEQVKMETLNELIQVINTNQAAIRALIRVSQNHWKADLQHCRESFAEKLREQSIDAEATPRSSRGVIKKVESSVIRHIEQGDKTHQPRVSKVNAMKIKQAAEELVAETQGLSTEPKPWDAAIQAKQNSVRKAWLNSATTLEKHTHSDHENNGYEDKKLANNIRHFVSVMPAIETERDQIKQKLLLKFTKQPEITRNNNENTVNNSKLKNELEL